MKVVKDKLIDLGFKEEIDFIPYNCFYKYTYNFNIQNQAEYVVTIKSFSNWNFEIEKEVKSLAKGVKSYTNESCFKGKISSLNVLETILIATGVTEIINLSV